MIWSIPDTLHCSENISRPTSLTRQNTSTGGGGCLGAVERDLAARRGSHRPALVAGIEQINKWPPRRRRSLAGALNQPGCGLSGLSEAATHRPQRDSDYMVEALENVKIRILEIDAEHLKAAQAKRELSTIPTNRLSDKELKSRRAERFPRNQVAAAPSKPKLPAKRGVSSSDRTGAALRRTKPGVTTDLEAKKRETELGAVKGHKSRRRHESQRVTRKSDWQILTSAHDMSNGSLPPLGCCQTFFEHTDTGPELRKRVPDQKYETEIDTEEIEPVWPQVRALASSGHSGKLSSGSGFVDIKPNESEVDSEDAVDTQTKEGFLFRLCGCFRSKQK